METLITYALPDRRSLRGHLAALALPFVILFGSSVALWLDFAREEAPATSAAPLATIRNANGDVKRKPDNRLVWYHLSPNQDVFHRDSVRTSENSTATVIFPDGSTVEVRENSLIVLEQSKDRVSIDFKAGNILAHGSGGGPGAIPGLTVTSQGVSVDTSGAAVALTSHNGVASVAVQSGRATIESGGHTATLTENQKGEITEQGLGAIEQIPFRLTAPVRDALVLREERSPELNFRWERIAQSGESARTAAARLEVARTDDFLDPVFNAEVGDRRDYSAKLEPGRYFWRLAGAKGALSEAFPFEVALREPVRLLEPANGKVVNRTESDPHITLSWMGPKFLDSYVIEVATDSEFKQIIHSEPAASAVPVSLTLDREGKVFWRVRGFSRRASEGSNALELTSESRELILVKPAVVSTAPLKLTEPASGAVFNRLKKAPEISFRWESAPAAEVPGGYRVQISKSVDFGETEISHPVSGAEYRADGLADGVHYWRVQGVNAEGASVRTSQVERFEIKEAPVIAAPAAEVSSTSPFSVHWPVFPDAREYELELTHGTALVTKRVSATNFESNLSPGKHGFRIRSIDEADRPGPWSEAREISVAPAVPVPVAMATPVAFPGEPGASASAVLQWREVKGATSYRVRVWKGETLLNDETVVDPNAPAKLTGVGSYAFEVAAVTEGVSSAFSEKSGFEAVHFVLATPSLLLPKGLLTEDRTAKIKFVWSEVPGARGYEIRIRRKPGWKAGVKFRQAEKKVASLPTRPGSAVHLGWDAQVEVATEESRGPASVEEGATTVQSFTSEGTAIKVVLPDSGTYEWEVQAVGGPAGHGEFQLLHPGSPDKISGE